MFANQPDTDMETVGLFLVADEYPVMTKEQTRELIYAIQDVIPEKIIARFDAIVHEEEIYQWAKGDLTNQIWRWVQKAQQTNKPNPATERVKGYTFLDICYFVSVRFLKRQRSHNTVKAWALVARRFPQAIREKYQHEDVPFSHFAYAAKRKFDVVGTDGKRQWQKILEFSRQGEIEQGYPVSVAQLEEAYEGKVRQFPTAYQIGEVEPEQASEESIAPEAVKPETEFADAIEALARMAKRLSGNPQVLSLIQQGLDLLKVAVEQLLRGE